MQRPYNSILWGSPWMIRPPVPSPSPPPPPPSHPRVDVIQPEKNKMSVDQPVERVVARTEFFLIPYTGADPQVIEVEHCVQFIQVDSFYGEFQVLDSSGRVLGTSTRGRLSFLRKDLISDVALVWYDALARTSPEFKVLSNRFQVADPGLDLGGLKPLKINFLSAPKQQERINHIPVYSRITCVWNTSSSALVKLT